MGLVVADKSLTLLTPAIVVLKVDLNARAMLERVRAGYDQHKHREIRRLAPTRVDECQLQSNLVRVFLKNVQTAIPIHHPVFIPALGGVRGGTIQMIDRPDDRGHGIAHVNHLPSCNVEDDQPIGPRSHVGVRPIHENAQGSVSSDLSGAAKKNGGKVEGAPQPKLPPSSELNRTSHCVFMRIGLSTWYSH